MLANFTRKLAAFAIFLFASTPVSADVSRFEQELIPEINLKIVCLEDPYSDGWEVVDGARYRTSHRYSLLQNVVDDTKFDLFRLVPQNQPCFYEFQSIEKVGFGTLQDTSGPRRPRFEVEGFDLPLSLPVEDQRPIVEELMMRCRAAGLYSSEAPFTALKDCETQVSDVLIDDVTSIYVLYINPLRSSKNDSARLRVDFVLGRPFINGKQMELW